MNIKIKVKVGCHNCDNFSEYDINLIEDLEYSNPDHLDEK